MKCLTAFALALSMVLGTAPARAADPPKDKPEEVAKAAAAARDKGLDWLTKNQATDGSWGKTYTIAVTSFACLAYLSTADEPYKGDHSEALVKGLKFLLNNQKDGLFIKQGHTWIHGQGFATLALAEAYGRTLLCKTKPDMDMKKTREVIVKSLEVIKKSQSNTGGWYYDENPGDQNEGSTTVCAVQAIVAASNYKIPIDQKVLDRGFAYLKKCQNKDGSFQYRLGDGSHMKEGTCADVATLGLMQQFDNNVMISGYKFLIQLTPAGITPERFPFYGHFYGCMGMMLLGQEFKEDKGFRENTQGYITAVLKEVTSWQTKDGSFPVKGWVATDGGETSGYATAFSSLILSVPHGRLSIYNRTPPKLPDGEK